MDTPDQPEPKKPCKPYRPPERCFQCDLDIPHFCYHGMKGVKWGYPG